jgi:hypothetical protein
MIFNLLNKDINTDSILNTSKEADRSQSAILQHQSANSSPLQLGAPEEFGYTIGQWR